MLRVDLQAFEPPGGQQIAARGISWSDPHL